MADQININISEMISINGEVQSAIDEVSIQYSMFKEKTEILAINWIGSEECGYQSALEIIEKEFLILVQVLVKMHQSIEFAQTQIQLKDADLTTQINANSSK